MSKRLPRYKVRCGACRRSFSGRMFHMGWTEPMRYCTQCPNLKIWASSPQPDSELLCRCGGRFDSKKLLCPVCGAVITDAERQVAVQHYVVEPARNRARPTRSECDRWYEEMTKTGYLGGVLFVQLRDVLMFNAKSMSWRYHGLWEV
ncbi:MAG: hypothetical protein V2A79_05280 [Planctomycetota bacterium]